MGEENIIGKMTFETASYVARYTLKQVSGDKKDQHYGVKVNKETGEVSYRLKPEFATMSRRPGIGATWFAKYRSDVYPSDEVMSRGNKAKPPAYYDSQLEKIDPKMMREVKVRRRIKAKDREDKEERDKWEVRETREKILGFRERTEGQRNKTKK